VTHTEGDIDTIAAVLRRAHADLLGP
jgi:hypothetical protein